jgi:hypothetical protein
MHKKITAVWEGRCRLYYCCTCLLNTNFLAHWRALSDQNFLSGAVGGIGSRCLKKVSQYGDILRMVSTRSRELGSWTREMPRTFA